MAGAATRSPPPRRAQLTSASFPRVSLLWWLSLDLAMRGQHRVGPVQAFPALHHTGGCCLLPLFSCSDRFTPTFQFSPTPPIIFLCPHTGLAAIWKSALSDTVDLFSGCCSPAPLSPAAGPVRALHIAAFLRLCCFGVCRTHQ